MELTGKCLTAFWEWLNKKRYESNEWYATWAKFEIISDSAKYGVYVDFFDSVGINIDIQPIPDYDSEKYTNISYFEVIAIELNKTDFTDSIGSFNTRPEARIEALKKANEIYNENALKK